MTDTVLAPAPIAKEPKPRAPKQPTRVEMSEAEIQLVTTERKQAFSTVFGRDYLDGFSDPIIFKQGTFYSPAVQQSYKRNFAMISRTLYSEYIYRRRPNYNQAVLDAFSTLAASKLAAINELLTRSGAQLQKLCRDNGVEADASYFHCAHKQVPIIHAFSMQYLQCLTLLDRVLQLSGSAALYGVVSSEQRREVELRCRRAINAFSTMVRMESSKLRREAQRVLASSAGDELIEAADKQHGQVLAEFDKQAPEAGDDTAGQSVEDLAISARAIDNKSASSSAPVEATVD